MESVDIRYFQVSRRPDWRWNIREQLVDKLAHSGSHWEEQMDNIAGDCAINRPQYALTIFSTEKALLIHRLRLFCDNVWHCMMSTLGPVGRPPDGQ